MDEELGPSQSRLHRIAERKLAALGVEVQYGPRGCALEGVLDFAPGQVIHPMTGQPVARARFEIAGHDRIRFLDPPLAALAPVEFYGLDGASAIGDRVAVWLRVRRGFLADAGRRLRRMGLCPREDPDRLVMIADVCADDYRFELCGGPDGIRATRVTEGEGGSFAVSPTYPPVPWEELGDLDALQLFLLGELPTMRRPHLQAPPAPDQDRLVALPPPRAALLSAHVGRFGPEAQIGVTTSGRIQVTQELEHGGRRYAFAAVHVEGPRFFGRLEEPDGPELWSGTFDAHRFPGIYELTMTLLDLPTDLRLSAEPEVVAELGTPANPTHLTPREGEVWAMSVLVESEERGEVRYSCLNARGQPYGATRVLARSDFAEVFLRRGARWVLLVRVEQLQGQNVVYRQLDARRQPRGTPKAVRIENLLANFVPERSAA